MKKISFKLLTLATVFASVLSAAQTNDDDTTLKQIAGYRQWQRVNAQPIILTGLNSVAGG